MDGIKGFLKYVRDLEWKLRFEQQQQDLMFRSMFNRSIFFYISSIFSIFFLQK